MHCESCVFSFAQPICVVDFLLFLLFFSVIVDFISCANVSTFRLSAAWFHRRLAHHHKMVIGEPMSPAKLQHINILPRKCSFAHRTITITAIQATRAHKLKSTCKYRLGDGEKNETRRNAKNGQLQRKMRCRFGQKIASVLIKPIANNEICARYSPLRT